MRVCEPKGRDIMHKFLRTKATKIIKIRILHSHSQVLTWIKEWRVRSHLNILGNWHVNYVKQVMQGCKGPAVKNACCGLERCLDD